MKGFIITESEKRQIRSLYSNKGFISEQGEGKSGSTKSTECVTIEVIGTFDAMVTEDKTNMLNFINKLNDQINKNETLKFAKEEGSLYISKITLIGGASNRYGGKVVKPTMDNNYNPKTYSEDAKYTGDFDANLQLAEDRAKNVWTELQEFLPKNNITIGTGVVPIVKKYVIDTNGAIDKTNKSVIDSGEFNPGQIVKMSIDLCGSQGSTDIKKCFESATIEVSYTSESEDQGHKCDNSVYEIYANGVPLKSRNKHDYASLNNKTIDGQIYPPDETSTQKNQINGNYVYNYFDLKIDGDNSAFFNEESMYKYDGGLVVDAKCLSTEYGKWSESKPLDSRKTTDCHKWVGKIKLTVSDGVQTVDVGQSQLVGTGLEFKTPNMFSEGAVHLVGFEACKKQ